MKPLRVLVAGEGVTELGDLASHPTYRGPQPRRGLIDVLIEKLAPDQFAVVAGIQWRSIRKYRARPPEPAEVRNVLGAALKAKELGLDACVFSRDRDRDEEREERIESALSDQRLAVPCAGGVAVETIESWVLALAGHPRPDNLRDPRDELNRRGCVGLDQASDLVRASRVVPTDATSPSLRRWSQRVNELGAAGS